MKEAEGCIGWFAFELTPDVYYVSYVKYTGSSHS